MECIWWWLDSWEFPVIMLACKICLATRVQLNDCSLCLKGETAVHLFMPPPPAWLHTLFSCFGLYTTIAWLDIHSASNPSCMLHTQLKSNQTKIVSCWGRLLFFSLYLLTFSCKKDISLSLSPFSEISCRFAGFCWHA